MDTRNCSVVLDILRCSGYSFEEISRMLGSDHPGPPEWSTLAEEFGNLPAWKDVQGQFRALGIPLTPEGLRQFLYRSRRAGSG